MLVEEFSRCSSSGLSEVVKERKKSRMDSVSDDA